MRKYDEKNVLENFVRIVERGARGVQAGNSLRAVKTSHQKHTKFYTRHVNSFALIWCFKYKLNEAL